METKISTSYDTKYSELVAEKNFYRLLLLVKTDLRKSAKKDTKEFFSLLIWCTNILTQNSESESCLSLYLYALDEYEKNFNKSDLELCLTSLKSAFIHLPEMSEKGKIKHRLLKFFEAKGITDYSVLSYEFYKIFANDSILNNEITEGLRYVLKSQDYNTLISFTDTFTKSHSKSENENYFFIARICLELLLLKNLTLSLKFISKYVDTSNNFQNNHPILNFAYLLTALFCKDASNFDYFWTFINLYKPVLCLDQAFTKYLNKISLVFFNKAIIQEEQGMNIMNMLRAFSN